MITRVFLLRKTISYEEDMGIAAANHLTMQPWFEQREIIHQQRAVRFEDFSVSDAKEPSSMTVLGFIQVKQLIGRLDFED